MTGRRCRHLEWTLIAAVSGLPALCVAVALLVGREHPTTFDVVVAVVLVGFWAGAVVALHLRSRYRLLTLANLLAALREGDYSLRLRAGGRHDAFSQVMTELNTLADTLRRQRVDDLEAAALVQRVMGEIEVAVFAFDSGGVLRQANRVGAALLGVGAVGRSAEEIGLQPCLEGGQTRNLELTLHGRQRRWEMRRGSFRQHGRPHRLVVLSDVDRALRAEELEAWRRLIRVLGHELNNSLAPIRSLADSLHRLVNRDPLPGDWRDDLNRGLEVISSRSEALGRFMSAYSSLAKMPKPVLRKKSVAELVERVATLETRNCVRVEEGPPTTIRVDPDQMEQVLINLVRNAVEAGGDESVVIGWHQDQHEVEIHVCDRGPGLVSTDNLFVPFFTTKPEGSGIGLFLCRVVVEAHSGSVSLTNRSDGLGCVARVRLPLFVDG